MQNTRNHQQQQQQQPYQSYSPQPYQHQQSSHQPYQQNQQYPPSLSYQTKKKKESNEKEKEKEKEKERQRQRLQAEEERDDEDNELHDQDPQNLIQSGVDALAAVPKLHVRGISLRRWATFFNQRMNVIPFVSSYLEILDTNASNAVIVFFVIAIILYVVNVASYFVSIVLVLLWPLLTWNAAVKIMRIAMDLSIKTPAQEKKLNAQLRRKRGISDTDLYIAQLQVIRCSQYFAIFLCVVYIETLLRFYLSAVWVWFCKHIFLVLVWCFLQSERKNGGMRIQIRLKRVDQMVQEIVVSSKSMPSVAATTPTARNVNKKNSMSQLHSQQQQQQHSMPLQNSRGIQHATARGSVKNGSLEDEEDIEEEETPGSMSSEQQQHLQLHLQQPTYLLMPPRTGLRTTQPLLSPEQQKIPPPPPPPSTLPVALQTQHSQQEQKEQLYRESPSSKREEERARARPRSTTTATPTATTPRERTTKPALTAVSTVMRSKSSTGISTYGDQDDIKDVDQSKYREKDSDEHASFVRRSGKKTGENSSSCSSSSNSRSKSRSSKKDSSRSGLKSQKKEEQAYEERILRATASASAAAEQEYTDDESHSMNSRSRSKNNVTKKSSSSSGSSMKNERDHRTNSSMSSLAYSASSAPSSLSSHQHSKSSSTMPSYYTQPSLASSSFQPSHLLPYLSGSTHTSNPVPSAQFYALPPAVDLNPRPEGAPYIIPHR